MLSIFLVQGLKELLQPEHLSLTATHTSIRSIYLLDRIIHIITHINQITLRLMYKKPRWDLALPISLNNMWCPLWHKQKLVMWPVQPNHPGTTCRLCRLFIHIQTTLRQNQYTLAVSKTPIVSIYFLINATGCLLDQLYMHSHSWHDNSVHFYLFIHLVSFGHVKLSQTDVVALTLPSSEVQQMQHDVKVCGGNNEETG